jgi:hypothetical protein
MSLPWSCCSGLAFGFAYFDRMAMTFLSPYVVADLELSNTQSAR